MSGFLFGSCSPCCDRCSCLKLNWSVAPDGNPCTPSLQGTWTIKVPDWVNGQNIKININGVVDDDVSINGQKIGTGLYIFACGLNGSHWIGGPPGYGGPKGNGHEMNVGREFTLGIWDNHGGGTGGDICICLNPDSTQYKCKSRTKTIPRSSVDEYVKIGGWQVKADSRAARSGTTLSVCELDKKYS